MALLPSESPAVTLREVDLSGIVPAVTSSTGAIVGDFNWGPIEQPILIGNEAELSARFGSPNLREDSNNIDFLTTSQFLKYSGSAYVVRAHQAVTELNAHDSDNAIGAVLVKNLADWNEDKSGHVATGKRFIAKYAGEAGNSLEVSICPWSGLAALGGDALTQDSAFENWAYKSYFDGAPSTSSYVSARSADSALAHDEVHIVITDKGGKFTGTPGTILETFPFVSLATDAKTPEGSNNFVLDVLNSKSSFVWAASVDEVRDTTTSAADFTNTTVGVGAGQDVRTQGFTAGAQVAAGHAKEDINRAFDQFEDEDAIQVDFLIAPGMGSQNDQVVVVNHLLDIAAKRKDCVVVSSPARDDVVNISNTDTITTNIKTFANAIASNSYLILDGNYLKVYDKYLDQYVSIPAAATTAGIMAATDNVAAPWFSPAGQRRGQYFGVSSLEWSPTKSQRDTLYKASVNPIVSLPGQGIVLFGDKTKLNRPSAFDRINVRRLFLVMERAIKQAAQNVMFEFNDEFTRAEFVNIVEPFLREIKGRRGITDFRVVCDETNNTADIIDTNQFVADIFVKPARSINYVTLSFVAVRTGVDFEEVVGLA